jgi:hypothetical protein
MVTRRHFLQPFTFFMLGYLELLFVDAGRVRNQIGFLYYLL